MENKKDEIIIGDTKFKVDLQKIAENEYRFNLYNRIITSDNGFFYENAHLSTLSKADIRYLALFFNSFIEDEKAEVPDAKLYELLEKLPAGWSISRGEKHECKDDLLYLTKDTGGNVCVNRLPYFVPEALKLLNQYHKTIPFGKELERQKIRLKVLSSSPLHNDTYDVLNYFIGESCLHGTLIVEEYINFKNCRTGELRIMDKRTFEAYYEVV